MNRASKLAGALLLVVLLAGAIFFVAGRAAERPPVTVTLRVSVAPQNQTAFVAGQASSARFKYLVGKQAGVKPALAQKLSIKSVANSALLEAKVGVLTKDEAQRYVAGFAETLQLLCGSQARVAVVEQSVR